VVGRLPTSTRPDISTFSKFHSLGLGDPSASRWSQALQDHTAPKLCFLRVNYVSRCAVLWASLGSEAPCRGSLCWSHPKNLRLSLKTAIQTQRSFLPSVCLQFPASLMCFKHRSNKIRSDGWPKECKDHHFIPLYWAKTRHRPLSD